MSIWAEVREQALLQHGALASSPTDLVPALELLRAAERATGIKFEARPPEDALLDGSEAVYDADLKFILYSASTDPSLAVFHITHEYAHHWLEEKQVKCGDQTLTLRRRLSRKCP